ncbi:O-antigen ligase family protein [Rhodococcus fascians]|nr:O-antigen ligase family protein [Rhodococcus fascians]MBY4235581.1 O-antigen ligase family protein [Rhodococcus fascians]MBY4251272.1 O-antigen ligase family protein [Rhodococcus fascians]MBY4266927.1 O-antigen ligase family protein [Rhodococcus fascians]
MWAAIALAVPIYRSLPGVAGIAWLGLTFAAIILSACLGLGARPRFAGIWVVSGYGALIAIITATELGTVDGNLRVGLQLFVALGLGAFALAGAAQRGSQFYPKVIGAFMVTQSLSSAAALIQLSGTPVLGFSTVNDRAPGLAGHPNVLGLMSAIALILSLTIALSRRNLPVVLLAAALNVGGLLATGSLSAMSACGLGLVVTAIACRVRVHTIVQTGVIVLIAFWALTSFTSFGASIETPGDRFLQVTGQTEAVSTLEIRGDTYQYAWDSIQRSPWAGVGLNSSDAASFDGFTVVHNLFLRSWFQGGVLLALGVALIVAAAVFVALQSMRRGRDGAAAGVLVAVMFFALTSAFFEQPYYWLPVLLAFTATRPDSISNLTAANIKPMRAARRECLRNMTSSDAGV